MLLIIPRTTAGVSLTDAAVREVGLMLARFANSIVDDAQSPSFLSDSYSLRDNNIVKALFYYALLLCVYRNYFY